MHGATMHANSKPETEINELTKDMHLTDELLIHLTKKYEYTNVKIWFLMMDT